MVTDNGLAIVRNRLKNFKLLASAANPDSQFNEVFQRQLLDGMLDFLNPAHGRKITSFLRKTTFYLSLPLPKPPTFFGNHSTLSHNLLTHEPVMAHVPPNIFPDRAKVSAGTPKSCFINTSRSHGFFVLQMENFCRSDR